LPRRSRFPGSITSGCRTSLFCEKGISPDTLERLRERGFEVRQRDRIGNVNGVMARDGFLFGYADPRALSGWVSGL